MPGMSREAIPFLVDAAVRRGAPQPVSDTLCIWDIRDFDDGGCFGKRVPAGWFKKTYPFVNTVIMMTFTGGKGYNEWITVDETGRYHTDFTVPVRILQNVLRQGVRPMVVIGQTPIALSACPEDGGDRCGWGNRYRPKDYAQYATYIRAFAEALVDAFGREELARWLFRVYTEPDNKSWWMESEEEFYKLYDVTTGVLAEVIGRENLTIAPGNLENVESWPDLLRHCALGTNAYTGGRGAPCDYFSISHYTAAPALGDLVHKVERMQERIAMYPELPIREYNVGEGQFLTDGDPLGDGTAHRLSMAQVSVAAGASWQAALYRLCQESGLRYFANWAYCLDYRHVDEPMLKTPAHDAAAWMAEMRGSLVSYSGETRMENGDAVGGAAVLDEEADCLRVMLYNHHEKWKEYTETVALQVDGLPWPRITVSRRQVDAAHGCIYTRWQADSARVSLVETEADVETLGSPVETELYKVLNAQDAAFWRSRKAIYAEEQPLELPAIFMETENGQLSLDIELPGHCVTVLEIRKA